MMTLKTGAVETQTPCIAKIGYTASIFIIIYHLIPISNSMMNAMNSLIMNPTHSQSNNQIFSSVTNSVTENVNVAITGAHQSSRPLPPLISNFSFRNATPFTQLDSDQDGKPAPQTNCERSGWVEKHDGEAANNFIEQTKTNDCASPTFTFAAELREEKVRDFSKLNRSDIQELFQHHELLSPTQLNLLRTVQRKQQLHPQRYRDDYLRHSTILLLSNGWSSASRYSMCSVPNLLNRSGQCKLHKFCPYCCYLERRRALARYVPAWESGIWFFLTGSFNGDLLMNCTNSYHELTAYWNAYKLALRELVHAKSVRGVFWTEELAVNSISPVHVLPHIHVLVEADAMDEETVTELSESVSKHLKAGLGPDTLTPNIHVKNLNSQRNLLSHVQYQLKPLHIVKAYDLAWSRALHNDRAGAIMLNSQTTDLVLGYSAASNDRKKINYAGNLSPKTSLYIGTKERDITKAQELVRDVIEEGVDYIEMESDESTERSFTA